MPSQDSRSPQDDRALSHPFYFIVVLWGERFRNYLLDLCLPTLMAPGNLPSLPATPRSKFIFCTRPEDWAAISSSEIFSALSQYVEPVFVEIPASSPGVAACLHMGIGHRQGCQMAYDDKAFPFVLTPDSIFSDGTIRRLQELAKDGAELVMVPALRFGEEPLFEQLERRGIRTSGRNGRADVISLSGRQLAEVCLPSMHSETKTYEWEAPYFHKYPSAIWWRIPGGQDIVVHCFSWAPLLFDFSAVASHDTSTFDNWTFDGDYVYRNLGNIKNIHLVCDSDEMFIASWAPLADKEYDVTPQRHLQLGGISDMIKKSRFSQYFYGGIFDPLKQTIFFEPIVWHARDIDPEALKAVESKALKLIRGAIGQPAPIFGANVATHINLKHRFDGQRPRPISVKLTTLLIKLSLPLWVASRIWKYRRAIGVRLAQAATGDRNAWRRIAWRFRQLIARLRGKHFNIPEPL